MGGMLKLVLLRHGESTWNLENRFTGWTDVDLTPKGVQEAQEAARLLEEGGYTFDVAYTSLLKRAIRTLWIALDGLDLMWLPVYNTWRLNERHYGALQGLNKAETAARYGEAQVKVWRRSYAEPPPALTPDDERYPGRDRRYAGLSQAELPLAESLEDTVARFLPYWHRTIVADIQAGKRVLIAAHGNSLRALVKHLDGMPEADIVELNIPTGVPLVYELERDLRPLKHYYLGDPEAIKGSIMNGRMGTMPPLGVVLGRRLDRRLRRPDGHAVVDGDDRAVEGDAHRHHRQAPQPEVGRAEQQQEDVGHDQQGRSQMPGRPPGGVEDLQGELDPGGGGQDARVPELGGGDVAQPPAGDEGDAECQGQRHEQERHRPIMTLSLPEREDPRGAGSLRGRGVGGPGHDRPAGAPRS